MMRWLACVALSDAIGIGHLVRVRALAAQLDLRLDRVLVWTDWSRERLLRVAPDLPLECVDLGNLEWPGGPMPDGMVMDMPDPPFSLLAATQHVPRKLLLGCRDARTHWADLTVNVAEGDDLVQAEPAWPDPIWRGARFAMLRARFLSGRKRPYKPSGAILVAIGGTDAARLTLPLVEMLLELASLATHAIDVVCAASHPDADGLAHLAATSSRVRILAPAEAIADWMERSGAAVVAPGNLLFECMALEVPAVAIAQHARQADDFRAYPWLVTGGDIGRVPGMLHDLLQESRTAWTQYARAAAVGQSLPMLKRWIHAPLFPLHSNAHSADSTP
ncbi:MAG: hypothetical protein K2Y26_18100 [Gemmatimonadaceae bacterium]|nr:hypothetical protein [Gemmatimonadaceae bacterium]